jgi:Isochorismatase family
MDAFAAWVEQLFDRAPDEFEPVPWYFGDSRPTEWTLRYEDRDYRVYVVSDATADPHQDVHEVLIRKVLPVHTWVVTSDELSELLSA